MIIAFANRHELIEFVGTGVVSTMVELGVFEGEFAAHCRQALNPGHFTLIDHWDYSQYDFVLEDAPQSRHIRRVFTEYFHGNPEKALHDAYGKVVDRFQGDSSVTILRLDIAKAAERFADGSIDLIYLDGSHTYEYVLRDLHLWFSKLSPGGLFVCNDFCETKLSSLQNIGVIPAIQTFSKRHQIYPILLSASDWSDFYFSNQPSSPLIKSLTDGLLSSGRNVVDIPTELLGTYHHNLIALANGGNYLLPCFSSPNAAFLG